ncbi:hypothetical protein FB480_11194 [Agrobacterium vitis]|nr:hypothetical protein FB480_11194 [Agrobacterium vitis]
MKKKIIVSVLFAFFVGGAFYLPGMMSKSGNPQCENVLNSRDPDGRYDATYIGVILTEECAKALIKEAPNEAPAIVLQAGFVSAVDGVVSPEQVTEYMQSMVAYGNHQYFKRDKNIISFISNLEKNDGEDAETIDNISDFILASNEDAELPRATDKRRFAEYMPIWRADSQRDAFRKICEEAGCPKSGGVSDICKATDFLALKMQYASNPQEVISAFVQCDFSVFDASFIHSLRRFGMIDTSCSPATQINEIARLGFLKGSNCKAILENIGFSSSVSSTDVIQFARLYLSNSLPKMDPAVFAKNLNRIRGMSPRTASLIEK